MSPEPPLGARMNPQTDKVAVRCEPALMCTPRRNIELEKIAVAPLAILVDSSAMAAASTIAACRR
jgi:hypothetical protein